MKLPKSVIYNDAIPKYQHPSSNFYLFSFLDIYNVLTIHGLCKCDPLPGSVTDINSFWKTTAYVINELEFSLDNIEHGILRGNKRHPSALSPPFSKDDPRVRFAMKECDPRIHFVLNCGAKVSRRVFDQRTSLMSSS